MGDICENLKVIPQFVGSCWFNSFLMSILYSQYSRNIIIKESINWDKKDKFFNILKYILKKNYDDPSLIKYYNHLQPQLLLFKFLKKYDINTEKYIKNQIKNNIKNFSWYHLYFQNFLKILNPNILDIYCDKSNNKNIINLHKTIDIVTKSNGENVYRYNDSITDIDKEKEEIKKIINDIPDYIILYHSELINVKTFINNYNYLKYIYNDKADIFDLSTHNIKHRGIEEYNDIIIFNGLKYKLDSCLLINYNLYSINKSHSIVGITCNDNRYVYNGWSNKTSDPAIKDEVKTGNKFPCSLMKYDWDLRTDNDFCLNSKKCKLDFEIDKKDLCFSFGKGERILVYVRIDDFETPKLTSLNSDKVKLSDINELIKDIYQIDDLNKEELIKHILYFKDKEYNYEYLDNLSIENLRIILYDKLIVNYDIPKKDLIIIPKFTGSNWFNSFLMSILYSQNARKMMMKESINWNKKDKFFNILKNILKRNYNNLETEFLLLNFLKKYDIEKNNLNNFYYLLFIKKLTSKVIDIYYDKNIINFHKKINIKNKFLLNYNKKININDEKEDFLKIIKDIPNFIVLYHSKILNIKFNNDKEANLFDLSNYNFKINDDIIIFNDIKYKLDSCIINKYDNDICHSIIGITHNNNKYIYINSDSLIKYNWNLKNNDDICLNIDNKDICFSFDKDERILIYVRIDEYETPKLTSLSSNKIKILDNEYEILNEEELKEHLLYFYLSDYNYYNIDKLSKDIDEWFNGITKEELIKKLSDKIIENYDIYDKKIKIKNKNISYKKLWFLKQYQKFRIAN